MGRFQEEYFGVRKKDFNKVSEKLIKFGYTPINFRFYKIFDRESKKEISENESKKRPLFKNFYLYVDLVLDEQIKGKTTFFNDKIIKFSFENKLWLDKNGFKVIKPELLVLIKIRILESRDEEKRLKDVLDSLFISNFSNLDIDFFRQLKEKFGINEVNIDIARKILDSRELDLELSGLRFDSLEIRSIKTSFISLLNF